MLPSQAGHCIPGEDTPTVTTVAPGLPQRPLALVPSCTPWCYAGSTHTVSSFEQHLMLGSNYVPLNKIVISITASLSLSILKAEGSDNYNKTLISEGGD